MSLKSMRTATKFYRRKNRPISTSNHMFGRTIWDKLSECIFENFEIAQEKRGQYQTFQKPRRWFILKIV